MYIRYNNCHHILPLYQVMLKRYKGSVSFKRKWIECENGFGDMHGDFWFGKYFSLQ